MQTVISSTVCKTLSVKSELRAGLTSALVRLFVVGIASAVAHIGAAQAQTPVSQEGRPEVTLPDGMLQSSAATGGRLDVGVPNGFASVFAEDLKVQSRAGVVAWARTWNGQEWKFNPQWESLSQSWANLTGSQAADTTASTASADSAAPTGVSVRAGTSSAPAGNDGCWVWVDEDWQPTPATTLNSSNGGPAMTGSVLNPVRSTPFNRRIGDNETDYVLSRSISIDYAALCPGAANASSVGAEVEGIRRINQLFTGESGRYTFNNRSVLEKKATLGLPQITAAAIESGLVVGRFSISPTAIARGYVLQDRAGDWLAYNTQGQLIAWGDRNNNIAWLLRDTTGRLRAVLDGNGRALYSLHYTADLLTEVRDYPLGGGTPDLPARSVRYQYDDFNRLNQVTDARGNITRYAYDFQNRIVQVTDPEERVERFTYSGETIKQRVAGDGGVTDYNFEYDDTNKQFISRIIGPETAAGRRVEDLTHNRVGQLVRRIVNGRIEEEVRYDTGARSESNTNARGFATRTTLNEFDQVVEVAYADGAATRRSYSALHLQQTEEIDEEGFITRYEHDDKGNLLRKTEAVGSVVERSVEYSYNSYGQVTHVIRRGRNESNGTVSRDSTWQIEYDIQGNVSQTSDPEGFIWRYVYDRAGNLMRQTDPRNQTIQYEFDAHGNLVTVTDALGRVRSFAYDKTGNLVTQTDARGRVTRMVYDAMNRRLQTTNALGGVSRTRYDSQGSPVLETDEDGRTSRMEYDSFLRVTRQVGALNNVTQFGYQVADGSTTGRLGSLSEPTETDFPTFSQQTRFDALERPTSQSFRYRNGQGDQIVTSGTTHDRRGLSLTETDTDGNTRRHSYNGLGQRIETIDSLGGQTRSQYDIRGNLLQLTDAAGNIYRFEYDRNNRVTAQVLSMGQTTRFSYDAMGNLAERTDPRGSRYVYAYDAANRLIQVRQYNAAATLLRTTAYTLDENDKLTAWIDTDATRLSGEQVSQGSAIYDDVGRKTGETITYPTPGGSTYTLSYSQSHSPAGKKTRLVWPDGTNIDYAYSPHGELASVSIPGEGSISVNQFKWTAAELITLPGGSRQSKLYDGLLELEMFTATTPGQQTVLALSQRYGKRQEIQSRTRTDNTGNASRTQSNSYQYDSETRLVQAVTESGSSGSDTEVFTLDILGNRTLHSKQSGAWTYDANNRLIKRGGTCGTTDTVCYVWDDAGNMIRKTEAAQVTRYVYDAMNRLIEVLNGSSQLLARYGYDPLDRRIWKEQYRDKDGTVLPVSKRTYYLYSDEGLIAEAEQSIALNVDQTVSALGIPVIATQYGPKPESEFTTGTLFVKTKNSNGEDIFAYYHHDHLNTPLQAIDKQGNVVWAASYSPFGKASIITPVATASRPTIRSSLRLPGQYEDEESGLHYNFRRYYDSETGRYISQDPIGLEGGLNLFAYAHGNPLVFSDSTGEIAPIVGAIAVAAARAAAAAVRRCAKNPVCRCRAIYAGYKTACGVKCDGSYGCTALKVAYAASLLCHQMRAWYVGARCDKYIPTTVNHPGQVAQARDAAANCLKKMTTACRGCQ